MRRAQANLPALVVALLVVSTAIGMSLALADGAFAGATRSPGDRRAAVALSERLVSADSPVTVRKNVLNRTIVARLNASSLRRGFPVVAGHDFSVRLGNRTLVSVGDSTGGVTMRRIVLVAQRQPVELTPRFTGPNATVTLPRRSRRADLTIHPPAGTTVRTVRANGRVVRYDPAGLDGTYRVRLARLETTTLALNASASLPAGSVTVTYYPERTTKATLVVTVDG